MVFICNNKNFNYICKKIVTMNYDNLANRVEGVVRTHVGLDAYANIIGTKKGACVEAKHLSIFVLHTLYCVPISWLAKRYSLTPRMIMMAVAQIRNFIKFNNSYRESCSALFESLEFERVSR